MHSTCKLVSILIFAALAACDAHDDNDRERSAAQSSNIAESQESHQD